MQVVPCAGGGKPSQQAGTWQSTLLHAAYIASSLAGLLAARLPARTVPVCRWLLGVCRACCSGMSAPPALTCTPSPPSPLPLQGVYAGGVESASALVRRGEASPRDFMLLSGYSGWGPWQLQQELRGGTWLPVAASQAVIMDCLRGRGGRHVGCLPACGLPASLRGLSAAARSAAACAPNAACPSACTTCTRTPMPLPSH